MELNRRRIEANTQSERDALRFKATVTVAVYNEKH